MSYLNSFKKLMNSKLKTKKENKDDDEKVITDKLEKKSQNRYHDADQNVVTKSIPETISKNASNATSGTVTGKVDLEPQKDDDPEAKLKELNQRYELLEFYDAPDSLGLETKEIPSFDENQTRKNIESKNTSLYEQKKKETSDDYKKYLLDLEYDEKQANVNAGEKVNQINQLFDEESFAVESQAIKPGLARSSIVLGELSRVENDRANELLDNMENLEKELQSIQTRIDEKTTEYENALENLEIEKAEKIEKEVQEAYEQYRKSADEVIEFNNKVKQLEAEYKIKYEKEKAAFKEDILDLTKYGYDEYRKKLEMSKYNYMVSYLSQFSKDEAFEIFFKNSIFKDLLGSNYEKVVEYLYTRK